MQRRAAATRAAARGFTLVELMVGLTVMALVLAIAVPGMSGFIASQRVKTGSFDVYSAMMFARSEAIKRRPDAGVSIVASSTDWSNGWTVCLSATYPCATADTLRTQDATTGVVVTSSSAMLTYRLNGRLTTGDALLQVESQLNANQAGRRCITVDTTGLPRSRALQGAATCP